MSNTRKKIIDELYHLIGKENWGFVAGKGTGSILQLLLGNKIPLNEPNDNTNLSDEVRNSEAEYILYIECVWRLDSNNKIICGAWDSNSKNGRMLKGLSSIVGINIVNIEVIEPAFDLIIEFSNSHILKIFCDQTSGDKYTSNYSLFTKTEILSVGCNSKIEVETREN